MALFDNFLSELVKTFGGGPSSADIGRNQQAAIAGGRRVLGLDSDLGPQYVDPLSVSSTDGSDLMSVMPPIDDTVETSIVEPGAESTHLAPAPVAKSSRAKARTPQPAVAQVAADTPASVVEHGNSDSPDAIASLLKERRGKYSDEATKALADAKSLEKMSDDEKIAYALLGALPGLVGLVGGALAGGGWGAAAGAAGGLKGGAEGMQLIAADKKERRKELLDKAAKAADRLAHTDDQELTRAEQVANQGFTAGQAEKGRAFEASQNAARIKAQAELAGKEIASHEREGAANRANQREIKRMDIFGDALKQVRGAGAGAGAGGAGKIDDTDKAFYKNTGVAMREIAAINQLAKQGGGLSAWLSNPEARAALQQSVYGLAHAYTKIGDPNSAVLLGELDNTLKTMLENPDTTREKIFLRKINALAGKVAAQAQDWSDIQPNVPLHPLVQQYVNAAKSPQQRQALQPGTRVRQNGHEYIIQADGSAVPAE